MTFALSPEHEMFRRSVREFAEAEVAPHVARWDKEHYFPVDLVKKMGDPGLFGLTAPEEFGGDGATSPACVSRSRSSAGSTSRSASRSRRPWGSASTRS